MCKWEKYINFVISCMCSDDKIVNVYSFMVVLVFYNECVDGYVVLICVIVYEKVYVFFFLMEIFVKGEWIV